MSREAALARALSAALGVPLAALALRPAAGGCINAAATCVAGGRAWFVKWNERDLPGQFAVEAAGLRALAESACGLIVPRPLAWDDGGPGRGFLVLEELQSAPAAPESDEVLGRGLAALHAASDARGFGFDLPGYCGATPQPNPWTSCWSEFFREQRLGHQLRLAAGRGLSADALSLGERVCARLDELLGDPEPSALLHGDLWSGNLFHSARGPALIDPAAYYGHREAELGMMVLFGGFSARVFAAYREAAPLAPGWEERVELYSAYHLLNHFNLFGGAYGAQAARVLRRFA